MIEKGMSHTLIKPVEDKHTAKQVASGLAEVLATPMMVAFMEEAAMLAIAPELEAGQSSVGTRIDTTHIAATPVDMAVTITATVTEVDRRRVSYIIEASDEVEKIGTATHDRFVIDSAKFQEKADAKKSSKC